MHVPIRWKQLSPCLRALSRAETSYHTEYHLGSDGQGEHLKRHRENKRNTYEVDSAAKVKCSVLRLVDRQPRGLELAPRYLPKVPLHLTNRNYRLCTVAPR